MAGLEIPEDLHLDGISFAPVLKGETTKTRHWLYSYLKYKHAFRTYNYYLDPNDSLWHCSDPVNGQIEYTNVTNDSTEGIMQARELLDSLNKAYPQPDTLNNPKYERMKQVEAIFEKEVQKKLK